MYDESKYTALNSVFVLFSNTNSYIKIY